MATKVEMSDSDKLSDIACIYNGMSAIIQSYYQVCNGSIADKRIKENTAYGLVMALEVLSDRVGEHAGVI